MNLHQHIYSASNESWQEAENEEHFCQVRGNAGVDGSVVVVDGVRFRSVSTGIVAKFPKEYGSPMQWLRNRLRNYSIYLSNEQLDDSEITFVVNANGSVSDVELVNMPVTGPELDFDFQNEVRRQVLTMPRWEPATRDDKPVSSFATIPIREMRP